MVMLLKINENTIINLDKINMIVKYEKKLSFWLSGTEEVIGVWFDDNDIRDFAEVAIIESCRYDDKICDISKYSKVE